MPKFSARQILMRQVSIPIFGIYSKSLFRFTTSKTAKKKPSSAPMLGGQRQNAIALKKSKKSPFSRFAPTSICAGHPEICSKHKLICFKHSQSASSISKSALGISLCLSPILNPIFAVLFWDRDCSSIIRFAVRGSRLVDQHAYHCFSQWRRLRIR
jgi:hypothetical protein